MGYACPVCDAEQADAEHLANHLAITASLGREDHRAWLEEHAPEWGECNPEELGEIVSQYVPAVETPEFEDAGNDHGHDHDHGRPEGLEGGLARQSSQPGRGSLTSEAESVLQEARELTRQMEASGSGAETDVEGDTDADGDSSGDDV